VERHVAVDPRRTLFRPGSIAKLFTWTAVMQLVEQGKLDLDRDVNDYLDFRIPAAFGTPITLRTLMTHSAGFEEVAKNVITADSTGVQSLEEFVKAWTPRRIFPPGQVPAYSNYGAALAGYIVQRVSGERYDDYMERHILGPLGMERATFRQPLPDRFVRDMSKGYRLGSGQARPYERVIPTAAGSLAATGHDMGLFMLAQLQDGRFGPARILKPETVRLMQGTALTILPHVNRMVLGFYESNRNGRRVIAHSGDTYFFHSELHLFIDDGIGLYVAMNSQGKPGAVRAIRSHLFDQFADRYLPGTTDDGQVAPAVARAHGGLLAGHYDDSRRSASNFLSFLGLIGNASVWMNRDGTVSASFFRKLDGQPKRWREVAPFVWREVDGKAWLAARVENGKVAMFAGDNSSPYLVFTPMPWWRSSAWLLPLLGVSALALLGTVVLWPTAAMVRRHFRLAAPLTGTAAKAYRWVRIGAGATVLTLFGWMLLFSAVQTNISALTSRIVPWVLLLQVMSLVAFVGTFAAAVWHGRMVWSEVRGWAARVWSVVLVVASLTVLWTALAYKLIGWSPNF
jgi:CubicO group peptidase (beta-lactamase class C family)